MTTTSAPNQATPNPFRRAIAITLAVIAVIVVGFFVFASLYADWLWFDQLGFSSVLWTQWSARVIMFVIGFLAMAVPVFAAIQLAYRLRPVYARLTSQLDHYQEVVEPLRRLAMWGIPVFFGFFAGFAASAQWETVWLWFNRVDTGELDPQFQLDTGFYLFSLPFFSSALGFASAVLLVSLIVTALVAYLYGSVRVGQRELRISKAARIQLAVIAGLYLLVQGVSIWLDRYKTLTQQSDRITGASYVDDHAIIPGLTIIAIAAVIVAVLFFVTAIVGRWRFPLIGTGLLIVSALVVGVAYPWVVTNIQVRPNQETLESPYYQRNIDATKKAYGIDGLTKSDFQAVTNAETGQLRSDAETTASIRIMDPAIISPTVRQLEQYRSYYQFTDPLDVDRYQIDGKSQDTVVSLRELNIGQLGQAASWYNSTLVYTHGYGMVAAKGNERTADGNPVFVERGIPTTGALTTGEQYEPRVYFGENSPAYSIVGAPEGTPDIELDYPRGTGDAAQTKTTFSGDGGPNIGNPFNRLIYSLKFQSTDILFSDGINADSQILYDRNPIDRVNKVAPYLELDNDPYPSVVDGRIVWIVDGYTLSANYPYSSIVSLRDAISDTTNTTPRVALDDVNYIRNSVKATVDAYDGKVTLYAWDDTDPLLQAWQKVYPSTLKPLTEMSGDLMSHVRYPTDLFKVQRAMLGTYHVDDAGSFYQRDNAWKTPNDPVSKQEVLQPPYYLTMKMPGQQSPTYSMFTTFIPGGDDTRNVLMGYLSVDSDAGATAGVKDPNYGKLRMLEINAETPVPGPGQVQNTFNSEPDVSSFSNLLNQNQSQVLNGNLLTLPVGGGLLYVQPVFVQSSGSTKLPTLQKILVAFGNQVAFENTLQDALDKLFGGDSGASTGDGGVTPSPSPSPSESGGTDAGTGSGTGGGTGTSVEFQAALKDAQQAMMDRQAALTQGDWTKYGEADARLTAALQKLLQLEGQG
ncbi:MULTISPECIES: UPF0182 family protein [Microbacterium]|uniref:UPF0182 protein CXR34_07580 n=1 Tax=Microbacterium hominis TaxID=162426 RepID=A0A134DG21_9MICO|nr:MULTISPECIES: UPF0182 family protein [Microbacterium]AUG29332.1 UPF0182 family protein [Microbacterium hominis]KXC05495.1 hypothetical protein MhomT_10790 [Microbacterium hominis]QOC25238.1 UPF0182 family protein [Microbacterium hominis]QOC29264.1 UPF0182 family protein [Microbacterium hominis]QYF98533.1 UPF0182 family protein [Microbacterium sp. PAMC21962]